MSKDIQLHTRLKQLDSGHYDLIIKFPPNNMDSDELKIIHIQALLLKSMDACFDCIIDNANHKKPINRTLLVKRIRTVTYTLDNLDHSNWLVNPSSFPQGERFTFRFLGKIFAFIDMLHKQGLYDTELSLLSSLKEILKNPDIQLKIDRVNDLISDYKASVQFSQEQLGLLERIQATRKLLKRYERLKLESPDNLEIALFVERAKRDHQDALNECDREIALSYVKLREARRKNELVDARSFANKILSFSPDDMFAKVQKAEVDYLQKYPETMSVQPQQTSNILDVSADKAINFEYVISQAKDIHYLYISSNELSTLPPSIGLLKDIEEIDASNNRIQILPVFMAELVNLQTLDLSLNQLRKFPDAISRLPKLENLGFRCNQLTSLPKEINNLKLKTLDLRNNPLPIPPEILEKTSEPQSILNYYFSIVDAKTKPLNEIKLVLIGQGSVGKTSLVRKVTQDAFDYKETKTEGISINHWHVEFHSQRKNQPSKIQFNIWDFGGQEIMHATHQFFLTKRSLYLLVLDSRLTQEENRIEYWLKIIQSFGGESPVLLVGNKIDQHPLDIDRTGLQKKYPNIVGILETSAATGAGIEELKQAITWQVNNLPHVRDLLPETWFTVKTKLEGLGRESNFITHDKYLELCAENEVSDETSQRTLIGFLHDLGVVLHFQDDPRLEALGMGIAQKCRYGSGRAQK